ncbi:hypothetical protein [Paraburkholderia susongensis]|uniref:Uncharacterized protein n=1 Tax=Paraburkholderia susongensis TaxID=1515439 RepID=A0A1X7M6E6_9BURK|nr:hypothetical protein [Paraburkholderia susongensis]SMG61550.1 hypothetical protein SAMN06265784_12318 [Paraburkholderia susongensis]
MSETTVRDALLAEALGELYTLREDVAALMKAIPDARSAIESGGQLATLRFAEQTDKAVAVLDGRIAQMAAAVKEVGAMRETLIGAVAAHATEEARTRLVDVVESIVAERRTDDKKQYISRALTCLACAVIGGSLVAAADIALRLISH